MDPAARGRDVRVRDDAAVVARAVDQLAGARTAELLPGRCRGIELAVQPQQTRLRGEQRTDEACIGAVDRHVPERLGQTAAADPPLVEPSGRVIGDREVESPRVGGRIVDRDRESQVAAPRSRSEALNLADPTVNAAADPPFVTRTTIASRAPFANACSIA